MNSDSELLSLKNESVRKFFTKINLKKLQTFEFIRIAIKALSQAVLKRLLAFSINLEKYEFVENWWMHNLYDIRRQVC